MSFADISKLISEDIDLVLQQDALWSYILTFLSLWFP